MMIRPIQTEYNGYLFRSRLEARWAVFFDELGIEYEYEPQGFMLPNKKKYLPDFYLPKFETYVEVKPVGAFSFDVNKEKTAYVPINGREDGSKYLYFANEVIKKNKYMLIVMGDPKDAFKYYENSLESKGDSYLFYMKKCLFWILAQERKEKINVEACDRCDCDNCLECVNENIGIMMENVFFMSSERIVYADTEDRLFGNMALPMNEKIESSAFNELTENDMHVDYAKYKYASIKARQAQFEFCKTPIPNKLKIV